ncbi:hypothetical protein EI555_014019, partial [Monodon monoceros]
MRQPQRKDPGAFLPISHDSLYCSWQLDDTQTSRQRLLAERKLDGTITLRLLHPMDPHDRRTRLLPCKMGNKTRRLQFGLNVLHVVKEEKNKVHGPYNSYAPTTNSMFTNISKNDSDLIDLSDRKDISSKDSSASISFWPYPKIIHINQDRLATLNALSTLALQGLMSQGNRVENIILFRELQEAQNECCSTDCLSQALRTLLHRQYLPEQVTNNLKERAQ